MPYVYKEIPYKVGRPCNQAGGFWIYSKCYKITWVDDPDAPPPIDKGLPHKCEVYTSKETCDRGRDCYWYDGACHREPKTIPPELPTPPIPPTIPMPPPIPPMPPIPPIPPILPIPDIDVKVILIILVVIAIGGFLILK